MGAPVQAELFEDLAPERPGTAGVDPTTYDRVIVFFSGGKDSLACVLHLLELGVARERIELWHHLVDGHETEEADLMDWPCTGSYCTRVAGALGVPIRFSWREGGFLREMLRDGTPTAPVRFERPDGTTGQAGGRGPAGRRLRFPQVSADLRVRWCSAYLKIDVAAAALRNDPRFCGVRTLVVSGERAEESAARARYAAFERHRTDRRDGSSRRHVDHWRPIHGWPEAEVWAIIRRHGIVPHPAYRLGWGRVSCLTCIFGDPDQWASVRAYFPERFARILALERRFGCTIRRDGDIARAADHGTPYPLEDPAALAQARMRDYDGPVRVPPETWQLPAGAFRRCGGPS